MAKREEVVYYKRGLSEAALLLAGDGRKVIARVLMSWPNTLG